MNQKFLMNHHYLNLRKNLINQKNLLSPKKQMNQNFLIGLIYLKFHWFHLNLKYRLCLNFLNYLKKLNYLMKLKKLMFLSCLMKLNFH